MKKKDTIQIMIPPYGMRVSVKKPTVEEFKDMLIAHGVTTDRRSLERMFHVARPGKTERERAKGHRPYVKNRRIWTGKSANDPAGEWIKAGGGN